MRGKVCTSKRGGLSALSALTLIFFFSLALSQDDLIEKEKASYTISGGCCALAAIHMMGKLYVANAGDSR